MTAGARASEQFQRSEVKFRLHHTQARELLRRISPHLRRDRHAGADGFYTVTSLYYDSPALACYWEKLDGEKYRRKVRVRVYGDAPEAAWLEIKQRLDLNVRKRRTRAPVGEVLGLMERLCAGRSPGVDDPVVQEVETLVRRYRMRPTLVVSYQRAAFRDPRQPDLRITLDRDLRCRDLDLSLERGRSRGRYALDPRFLVLEVKTDRSAPRWLATALNAMDLQVERFSKYCAGVEQSGLRRLLGSL